MAQFWTKRNDQEDKDAKTFCPWSEKVMKEDRANILPPDLPTSKKKDRLITTEIIYHSALVLWLSVLPSL